MPKDESTEAVSKPISNLRNLILSAAERLDKIEEERDALNDDANAIRQELRDAGVQIEPFKFTRRLKNQEQEARDEYLDQLRINFAAFGIGGQMELFDDNTGTALEVLADNPPEKKAKPKK